MSKTIHRQGTNFSFIIRNAKAFIQAGGRAQWDFIVFKHNEHQVEQAREFSKKVGFQIFQIKRTSRFYKVLYEKDPALKRSGEKFGKCPTYDSNGQQVGYVELPTNPCYCNDSLTIIKTLIKEFGSLDRYFDSVLIDCQAKKTKGLFVSADGLVYPCCWIYQQTNYGNLYGVKDPLELNEEHILNTVGKDKVSAKKYLIKDIVRGDFFKKIEKSWNICGIKNGRSKVCARHCGYRLDMHEKQHKRLTKNKVIPSLKVDIHQQRLGALFSNHEIIKS